MQTALENYFNGLCCPPIPLAYNFDVDSSNWIAKGVYDQFSFSDVFNVNTDYFSLVGNTIKANIIPSGFTTLNFSGSNITAVRAIPNLPYTTLNFFNNQITEWTAELPSSLTLINLSVNQLTSFNPISWPIGLTTLQLNGNLLQQFNPTALMPNTVNNINLGYNQFNLAGYTASEPWASGLHSTTSGIIFIDANPSSASGTTLQSILVAKGWTVQV